MAGHTVLEVMNGISKLVPAFRNSREKIRVQIAGYDSVERLNARTDDTEIHVFPAFACGSGRNLSIGQIILGAVLITVGIAVGGSWVIPLVLTGSSMILGGLIALLSPSPNLDTGEQSKYLGAQKNTVKSGTPIPLLFGRHIAYGHFLSFDVDAHTVWNGVSSGSGGYSGGGFIEQQQIASV